MIFAVRIEEGPRLQESWWKLLAGREASFAASIGATIAGGLTLLVAKGSFGRR